MAIHLFGIALFLLLGIAASRISSLLKVPILLVFLAMGMLLGSDGIGKIPYDSYENANMLGTIALAFILFSGGYDTRFRDIRPIFWSGVILSTLGVLITAVLIGFFVAWFLGIPPLWGLLLGAIISSTDAAAVFAIFRSKSFGLKGRIRSLLEFESGSNDPMAAFLTLFILSMLIDSNQSFVLIVPIFLVRMTLGFVVGWVVARGAIWLFSRIQLEYEGLYYVLGITTVFMSYSLGELCYGNGFLAVYVSGIIMGNTPFVYKHGLARFNEGIAWLMQVTVFLVLGLLVNPSDLTVIALESLVICLVLMFLVRPIAVYLSLTFSKYNWKEKIIVSWGGFRGAAPIVLATFPALALTSSDQKMAQNIFNIVFFIVLTSIFIQGKTLMPVARLLKLNQSNRRRLRSPLEFEETGHSQDKLYEFTVVADSDILGKTLAAIRLPGGALVLLIRRQNEFVVPHGNTILERDDDLLVFFNPIALPEVEEILTKKLQTEVI